MTLLKAKNIAEGYKLWLNEILNNYEYETKPRNQKIREIENLSIEIQNTEVIGWDNEVRGIPKNYLAGELLWYFYGSNKVDFITRFSKFWNFIKNPDNETVNSAYGYLLFKDKNEYNINEWNWAYNSLMQDKDSRQAILRFNKPRHSFNDNKDFVCTLNGAFLIRNNKLDFTIFMRSSDAIRGITFDWPYFILLQQNMLRLIQEKYPEVSLGKFNFIAISAHIYEEHFELVQNMLEKDFILDSNIPKLDTNLVNKKGEANNELKNIFESINNEVKIDLNLKSEFLKYISKNALN